MQIITESYDLGRVGQSYFVRQQFETQKKTYFKLTIEELYILLDHFEASVKGCIYDYLSDIPEVSQEFKETLIGDICDCMQSHIDILEQVADEQKHKNKYTIEDIGREGKEKTGTEFNIRFD